MRQALLVAALAVGACSTPLSPQGDLRGMWAAIPSLPVSSLVMNLSQADATITGTGTYSGELGHPGTLVVRGDVHGPIGDFAGGPTIDLFLTFDSGADSGLVKSFTGRLVDAQHMTGILALNVVGGSSESVTFVRQ